MHMRFMAARTAGAGGDDLLLFKIMCFITCFQEKRRGL